MSRGRAASRKDVALRAGVAPSTVSLVLNKTPGLRIAPETRRRVEEAARELGYQSSAIARALVTGRSHTIGVVLHYLKQPFIAYASAVLDGVWDELVSQRYRMLMSMGTAEACVAGLYRERAVDGLLLMAPPVSADDQELGELAGARFPAVCIGAVPHACRDRISYVDIDNVAAGRRCAEQLIAAGHRRIAHLAGPLEHSSAAVDRLEGFRQAMRAAGLPVPADHVIDCSFNTEFAYERLGAALDRGLAPTGIVAANYGMGAGAARALVARGRRIPADISITTIDAPADNVSPVALTRLEQPLHEVGAGAARLLLRLVAGEVAGPQHILLTCSEVAGASLGPPPRG